MRKDLITRKAAMIAGTIEALEGGEKVVARVGGVTIHNLGEEIAFQARRLQVLRWCQVVGRTDTQVRNRIAKLESQLEPEELACKYGNMRGLRPEKAEIISEIELLEIALGTHPGV